ncbi:MAG TPA: hypothetical protein VIV61_06030 [Candidatus Ozemobacteraceae bacterium]
MNQFRKRFAAALATVTPGLPPLPPGEEIYGLRAPVAVPFEWLPLLGKFAAILLLAFLGRVLWRRWFTSGKNPSDALEALPPVDPTQEALEALDRLRASPVWQEGRVKDICESLAGIFKTFVHGRCGIGPGASATTDELEEMVGNMHRAEPAWREALELLWLCDEVKFARGSLGGITCDRLWERFRALIEHEEWRR